MEAARSYIPHLFAPPIGRFIVIPDLPSQYHPLNDFLVYSMSARSLNAEHARYYDIFSEKLVRLQQILQQLST